MATAVSPSSSSSGFSIPPIPLAAGRSASPRVPMCATQGTFSNLHATAQQATLGGLKHQPAAARRDSLATAAVADIFGSPRGGGGGSDFAVTPQSSALSLPGSPRMTSWPSDETATPVPSARHCLAPSQRPLLPPSYSPASARLEGDDITLRPSPLELRSPASFCHAPPQHPLAPPCYYSPAAGEGGLLGSVPPPSLILSGSNLMTSQDFTSSGDAAHTGSDPAIVVVAAVESG